MNRFSFLLECFNVVEFLDTAMSGSNTFSAKDAQFGSNEAFPGTHLQIDLGIKHMISGFDVRSKCRFTLVYKNSTSNTEETYNEPAGVLKVGRVELHLRMTYRIIESCDCLKSTGVALLSYKRKKRQ